MKLDSLPLANETAVGKGGTPTAVVVTLNGCPLGQATEAHGQSKPPRQRNYECRSSHAGGRRQPILKPTVYWESTWSQKV